LANHLRETPLIGKVPTFAELKASTTTTTIGAKRNA